jgi:hypothetical protein
MTEPTRDPLWRQLAGLPAVDPDPIRRERIRARCHARLGRLRRRHEAEHRRPSFLRARWIELALVGSVSLFYLAVTVRNALAIYGGH